MNKNAENGTLRCEIVHDLLPLYHDGVVSKGTADAVKDHLENCVSCHREYDDLCAELPLEVNEPSTKSRFIELMRNQKRKRRLITVLVVLVACTLMVSAYFGQKQLLIANVPDNEITVHSVYRYETDNGYKFFVLYSLPYYDYTTGDATVENSDSGSTLVLSIKKPLITEKHTEMGANDCVWVYECGYSSSGEGTLVFEDYDAVEFGGNIVWDKTTNGDDTIPAYVQVYEEFNDSTGGVTSWTVSSEDGYLGAGYADGRMVIWSFDGTVLYDGYHNEGNK